MTHRRLRRIQVGFIAALAGCIAISAGCGGEARQAPEDGIAAATAAKAAGGPGDAWGGTIEVQVAVGSPLAGTYNSSGAGCARSPDGWLMAHQHDTDRLRQSTAALAGVGAGGGTTSRVSLTLVFGDPMDERDPNPGMILIGEDATQRSGSATATVARDGDQLSVSIDGRTQDGADVQVRYRCTASE